MKCELCGKEFQPSGHGRPQVLFQILPSESGLSSEKRTIPLRRGKANLLRRRENPSGNSTDGTSNG